MKSAVGILLTAALCTALPQVGRSTTACGSNNTNMATGPKLAWVEFGGDDLKCLNSVYKNPPLSREEVERTCGTERFCNYLRFEGIDKGTIRWLEETWGYADPQACFAAYEPNPTTAQEQTLIQPTVEPAPQDLNPEIAEEGQKEKRPGAIGQLCLIPKNDCEDGLICASMGMQGTAQWTGRCQPEEQTLIQPTIEPAPQDLNPSIAEEAQKEEQLGAISC